MTKLIACVIIENDEDVFELSLKSYIDDVDKVIIIDGNKNSSLSKYNIDKKYLKGNKIEHIHSPYPHDDIGADGKQRNKYLDHLKENHVGDWAVVVDADEVVEGLKEAKEQLIHSKKHGFDCYNVRMHHFISNLGLEDATFPEHFVQRRFFKVNKDVAYLVAEHTVPTGFKEVGKTNVFRYYHMGYARELFRIHKKYLKHLVKSNIHTPGYLKEWYLSHVLGTYPVSRFQLSEIPKTIVEHFGLEDVEEMIYFQNRREIEVKHFLMVHQWKQYFNPKRVLDVGCGMGHFLYAWSTYGVKGMGVDKSEYALRHSPYKKIFDRVVADITTYEIKTKHDLVTVLDVLEHLSYEDLDKALKNIGYGNKHFLFSIPFKGDPNLDLDPTHIIKEDKGWWIKKLEDAGFIITVTPEHFMFKHQLVVAKK